MPSAALRISTTSAGSSFPCRSCALTTRSGVRIVAPENTTESPGGGIRPKAEAAARNRVSAERTWLFVRMAVSRLSNPAFPGSTADGARFPFKREIGLLSRVVMVHHSIDHERRATEGRHAGGV